MRRDDGDRPEPQTQYAVMDRGELDHTFGYLLRGAWRDASRTFIFYFRDENITAALYAILILVERNPGCAPGDLIKPMGIGHNNLARLIEELVARKLVRRTVSPDDRRAKVLQLTPEGRRRLKKWRAIHLRYQTEFERRVGKANLKALVRILTRFDLR